MNASVLNVLEYLILILPALAVAWALAVWLPGRAFGRESKVGLAVLISYVGLLLTMVDLMATGVLGTFSDAIAVVTFPLLFTVPTMAGAAALLYFGGRAVRFRRSRARVILGCVSAVFGFLLWIGTALLYWYFVGMLQVI